MVFGRRQGERVLSTMDSVGDKEAKGDLSGRRQGERVLSTMDSVGDKEAKGDHVSANNEHGRASFPNRRPK